MKKTALVIGGSGDIGRAFVKALSRRGYTVYVPVRSLSKPEVKELMVLPNVIVSLCNVEKLDDVLRYFQSLANDQVHIGLFVLAVGIWRRDDKYPNQEAAFFELRKANVETKENIYRGIDQIFHDQQKDMIAIVVSSHAGGFKPGDKYYAEQIAYVTVSREVSETAKKNADRYLGMVLKEPGPINTKGYRGELDLTEEEAENVPGIMSPDVFAETSIDDAEKLESVTV